MCYYSKNSFGTEKVGIYPIAQWEWLLFLVIKKMVERDSVHMKYLADILMQILATSYQLYYSYYLARGDCGEVTPKTHVDCEGFGYIVIRCFTSEFGAIGVQLFGVLLDFLGTSPIKQNASNFQQCLCGLLIVSCFRSVFGLVL